LLHGHGGYQGVAAARQRKLDLGAGQVLQIRGPVDDLDGADGAAALVVDGEAAGHLAPGGGAAAVAAVATSGGGRPPAAARPGRGVAGPGGDAAIPAQLLPRRAGAGARRALLAARARHVATPAVRGVGGDVDAARAAVLLSRLTGAAASAASLPRRTGHVAAPAMVRVRGRVDTHAVAVAAAASAAADPRAAAPVGAALDAARAA